MSRGVGTGGSVWFDGYGFHGPGHQMDARHTHAAIHPKFRSAREDMNKGSFGCTASYDATPINPQLRRAPAAASKAQAASSSDSKAMHALTSAGKASSASSNRVVVELIKFAGAWSSKLVGSDDAQVYYVRQSSMRNKSDWTSLRAGGHVRSY